MIKLCILKKQNDKNENIKAYKIIYYLEEKT